MSNIVNNAIDNEDIKTHVKNATDMFDHVMTLTTKELADAITNAGSDIREGLMAIAESLNKSSGE